MLGGIHQPELSPDVCGLGSERGTVVPGTVAYRTFLHVGTVRRDHSLRWQQSAYVGDFLGEFRNFRRVSARKTGLDPLFGDLRHSPRGLSQAFCLWRFDFVSQPQKGPLFVRHGALARGRRPELVRHTAGVVWYRPCGHAQYAWLHGLPGLGLRWRQADFDPLRSMGEPVCYDRSRVGSSLTGATTIHSHARLKAHYHQRS